MRQDEAVDLSLNRNLGLPQHDNHFSEVLWEIVLFIGCSLIFLGSDKGPWGHKCAAWPLRMYMRLDEAAIWV